MSKRASVTVSINLTYDSWRDVEDALLDRAARANEVNHKSMADRLNAVRHGIETQVREQKPRW